MTTESLISIEMKNNVAIVSLDDAATRNAMSEEMAEQLIAALPDIQKNARAMILTGAGGGFCSGAKLTSTRGGKMGEKDLGPAMREIYNPLILALRNLTIPFISAVNGAAAGIGCSLSLMADLSIVSDKAVFIQAFSKIALIPDGCSSFINVNAAGRARAMEMALLDEKLSSQQAFDWGMINRVVPADDLMTEALSYAERLANGPTRCYASIRKLIWNACEDTFEGQLALEAELQSEMGFSDDHKEGLRGFMTRERPNFTGK